MRSRQLISLAIMLFCAVAFWIIKSNLRSDGEPFASGAALLPDLAVALMMGLSLLNLTRSYLNRNSSTSSDVGMREADVAIGAPQVTAIGLVAGLMLAFTLIFPVIGYLPVSVLLLVALMVAAGGRNKTAIVLVSCLTVSVLYVGLRYGLGVHVKILPNFMMLGG